MTKSMQIPAFRGIASLKGVEFFPNLEELACTFNELTEADVSCLIKLVKLNLSDNKINMLNVAGCTRLKELNCSYNSLKELP